jgi:hypothetical protein
MFALTSTNDRPRPHHSTLTLKSQPTFQSPQALTATPVPTILPTTHTPATNGSTIPPSIPTTPIPMVRNAKLTEMIIPVLLDRCKAVLHRFVIDDRLSGQCPLPRYRLAEACFYSTYFLFSLSSLSPLFCSLFLPTTHLSQVIFLLRELLYLELPSATDTSNTPNTPNAPHTLTAPYTPNTSTTTLNSYKNLGAPDNPAQACIRSQHSHLIELYPHFCECITSSERDIKDLLKEIFYLVGKEFLAVKRLK